MPRARAAAALAVVSCTAVLVTVSRAGVSADARQAANFRSGVELIAVDAAVVDASGHPVRGLRADQFRVVVDGRTRRVASAELIDHAAPIAPDGPPPRIATRPAFSSNDSPAPMVAPGRLIFILVDQASFAPSVARSAVEAARLFVSRLEPADRVGLVAFPPPGPTTAASTNRAAVLAGLEQVVGSAEPPPISLGPGSASLAQAVDIEGGDANALRRVVERLCSGSTGVALATCAEEVRSEAHETVRRARNQAIRTLASLRDIVGRLAKIPERKTLVLISAGLPSAATFGNGLDARAEISSLAAAAAVVNANIYVLYADAAALGRFSASARGVSDTVSRDGSIMAAGLDAVAFASGGTLFRVAAGAAPALERILLETSASYVLGVEPADEDRDGKPHGIDVSVTVSGIQVRSRRQFVLPSRTARGVSAEDRLLEAIRTSRAEGALPIAVSARTFGKAPLGGLRVLVIATVGRGVPDAVDVRVGYQVTDAGGDVVARVVEKQALSRAGADANGLPYVSALNLEPGDYRVRLAAVDSTGRVGSVQHPFSARLYDREGIRMGDLLLLNPAPAAQGLSPVVDGRPRTGSVDGHVEVYTRERGSSRYAVSFGVADRPDGEFLVKSRVPVPAADAGGHSAVEGRVDLGRVPPGEYFAVAVVSDGERELGRLDYPLRLEGSTGGLATSTPGLPRVHFGVGETNLVKAFEPKDLLAADALAYFVGRLAAADPAPALPGVAAAAAALQAGRFEAALASLRDAPRGRLSVPFLTGVALFATGGVGPAAEQFREALRIADDFLPAAFFLGACYAAGGHDREAAAAWQMALITESEARIVYDALADALLRLADAEQAVAVLSEARAQWPEDSTLLPRLAAAQALLGKWDEALGGLDRYLSAYPRDAEAAALAIRLMYEAHAAGATARSTSADRELAARYAAAYRASGGPSPALVDRWAASIGERRRQPSPAP